MEIFSIQATHDSIFSYRKIYCTQWILMILPVCRFFLEHRELHIFLFAGYFVHRIYSCCRNHSWHLQQDTLDRIPRWHEIDSSVEQNSPYLYDIGLHLPLRCTHLRLQSEHCMPEAADYFPYSLF